MPMATTQTTAPMPMVMPIAERALLSLLRERDRIASRTKTLKGIPTLDFLFPNIIVRKSVIYRVRVREIKGENISTCPIYHKGHFHTSILVFVSRRAKISSI